MIWIIIFSAALAIAFGFILAFASKKMQKNENELVKKIKEALPDKNCGGCGYANCEEYAKALANDTSLIGKCVLGGDELNNKLSEITGSTCKSTNQLRAVVFCSGGSEEKAEYRGIRSCKAAKQLGGFKSCPSACYGFGDCINVCEYDAIAIKDGVALIDENKCVACGKCLKKCPQGIIQLVPCSQKTVVKCSSKEAKKNKAKQCKNGCIGCGICARACPVQAIEIKDDLAIIDYEKCTQCGLCAKKCPRGVIESKNNLNKEKESKRNGE